MSGGTAETIHTATQDSLVAHIRNLKWQLGQWGWHPELGPRLQDDLVEFRSANPEAAAAYDAEEAAQAAHQDTIRGGGKVAVAAEQWSNLAATDPSTYAALCRVYQLDPADVAARAHQLPDIPQQSQGLRD